MANCHACGTDLPEAAKFCLECGTPQEEASDGADPLIGRVLGNYKVESLLGEGAMGKVYRAMQTSLARMVCIKTLHRHMGRDSILIKRFQREARATSALNHPNIVSVLDFGEAEDGLLYIVMELVEGDDLAVVIHNERLSLDRVLDLKRQILSALEEAHGTGLLHRDLKPANVLIARLRDGTDVAKVTDFGLAKLVEQDMDDIKLTATGAIFGTPAYMAPEQIVGEELDAGVDIYAAGIVLYEMLTGRPPFTSESFQETMSHHITVVPRAPSQASPIPIPPALDRIVMKALEKDRLDRYQSALEFKNEIDMFRMSLKGGAPAAPSLETQQPAQPAPEAAPRAPAPKPATMVVPRSAPKEASLRRLVPEKLVGHLGELKQQLASEKRNVTIIFAEIAGLADLTETLAPDEAQAVTNRCFEGVAAVVQRHDGTVDKYMGDSLMVLFGAPIAHEDDPERAIRCALDMLSDVAQINRTLSQPLQMRVGINLGEIVVGGADGPAIGSVVSLAQRLGARADNGKVVVSPALKRLTEHAVSYRALEPMRMRGGSTVEIFEVDRLNAPAAEVEQPFLGRSEQIARAEQILGDSAQGRALALLILGEPGVGKTRLLTEIGRRAADRGLVVARASGGRHGTDIHFDIIRQALFAICGGSPTDRQGVDQKIGELVKYGLEETVIERLQHVFGGAGALRGVEIEEGALLNRAAMLQPFLQVAAKDGLCLLVDDLHVADESSLTVLEEVLARGLQLRLTLFATARPGDSDRFLPNIPRMNLAPFTTEETLEIAKLEIGGGRVSNDVAEVVTRRAQGNPFVAREVMRSFIDSKSMVLDADAWILAPDVDAQAVPERVAQLVAARLDTLGTAAKTFLRCAAVAGRAFPLRLVAAALDTEMDINTAVGACVTRGFLATSKEEAGAYEFAQAVVHETVLKTMVGADLRHLHLRMAEALEQGGSPLGAVHPAQAMAEHFRAAGQNHRAIRYLVVAGDHFTERGAFAEAAEQYQPALELLIEGTRGRKVTEQTANQLLSVAEKRIVSLSMFAPERAAEVLKPVLEVTPDHLALLSRANAIREHGNVLVKLGHVTEAVECLNRATAFVDGKQEPERLARFHADLAAALEMQGDLPKATELLMAGFQQLAGKQSIDRDLLWKYLNQLGRIHISLGELDKAKSFLENARAQAIRAQSAVGESRILTNLGGVVAMKGDNASANSLFQKALELAMRTGDQINVARIHCNLGQLLAACGQRETALAQLQKAASMAKELGWREGMAITARALQALGA